MLTKEQEKARLNGIGGSDSAVVCGVSPWMSSYELWRIKTLRQVQEDIGYKPYVKAGNMLEGAVTDWFEDETKKGVDRDVETIYHKKHGFMFANLDGIIIGESAILECKTSSSDKGWGNPGTDQIPVAYLYQVRHYIAVANVDRCYVAVLIRGVDFRVYCVERNLALEDDLIQQEEFFWSQVEKDIAPEMKTVDDVLLSLDDKVTDEELVVGPDIVQEIDVISDLDRQIKFLEARAKDIKNGICIMMGEHQTLSTFSGTTIATWKKTKPPKRFNHLKLKEDCPDVYEKYIIEGRASRRFVIKREK